MRDATRRGAAENDVQKHNERLAGAWRQMSTLRRRYKRVCKGDDVEDCTHKQRLEVSYQSMIKVLQQNTWIDRKFLTSCVRARAQQYDINLHTARGRQTSFCCKIKQSVLRKVFERPARPLETQKTKNDGNCKNHSRSQMVCQNQTAIRYRMQFMPKGTRTTRCKQHPNNITMPSGLRVVLYLNF